MLLRLSLTTLLLTLTIATTRPRLLGPPCGFRIAACPISMSCSASDPSCPATRGENCAGRCVLTTLTTRTAGPSTTATEESVPSASDDPDNSPTTCLGSVETPTPESTTVEVSSTPANNSPTTCLDGYASMTTSALPVPSYQPCGGDRKEGPLQCEEGYVCVDDPRVEGCGMACDRPGVCVEKKPCGGYFGLPCPAGLICVEDPSDGCDPAQGAVDCNGVCV
ncbi:hypothetical protein jhhlp_002717 [Lomentospora prolificans]|uniref:IGFBP N-terminal domain-containing protein n=1 Tax=Lomentospora prolificans TaxID=41688 RepID=A0A2N3NEV4_9PEZI|nr:hypothetical protein jhhlp_002717 [Lomentospora prolificans]